MLKKNIATILNNAFGDYLKSIGDDTTVSVEVGYPAEESFGDYACATALRIAKTLKKNPMEIADAVIEKMDKSIFAHVTSAKPGFINMTLSETFVNECVNNLINDNNYGQNSAKPAQKILLEYVSANPTGPLHIGHGRWAAIGSSLGNLLSYIGHYVEHEFYVNDAGEQIEKLNRSIDAVKNGLPVPEDGYHGSYIHDVAKLEGVPKELILEEQKKLLESFNTFIKTYASETDIRESGKLEETIDFLDKEGYVYEKDDAVWFKSTAFGDDKDRVIKKTSGEYTYFAPDIAYHKNKIDRGFEYLINILGADHHGYVTRITSAVSALSDNKVKLDVILGQLVRLYRGKEIVRMSKRTGDMITLAEVIDEIGVDPTRYFLLMRSVKTTLDFDLELAKKKDNDNPVYYVQYAYARICNIFFKLVEKNMSYDPKLAFDITDISNPTTLHLAKFLLRLPDELSEAGKSFEVYPIVTYLYDLSSALHRFYYENTVLADDENTRQQRLKLIEATKKVLGILFDIIAISKVERMWQE